MDKIYLVVGSTGEYDDYSTWNVCAYPTEKAAVSRADELNQTVKALGLSVDTLDSIVLGYTEKHKMLQILRQTDSKASVGYSGISYAVEAVDFKSL